LQSVVLRARIGVFPDAGGLRRLDHPLDSDRGSPVTWEGKTYRWVEHTGELELSIEAPTETGVFTEALAALGELLGEEPAGEKTRHELSISASDPPALLAEWLSELVFLAETESFVPERAAELELTYPVLHAVVEGRRGEPPPLVKAVTYHMLELAENDRGWHGRVVLDV